MRDGNVHVSIFRKKALSMGCLRALSPALISIALMPVFQAPGQS